MVLSCNLTILSGINLSFERLSLSKRKVGYVLLTRAPVADRSVATPSLPLDLHVLSLSLAFILSQDQTLRCLSCFFYFSLSFRQPDQQPRIVPASALFFLLTEGFRPLPSSCLFIASFQCSLSFCSRFVSRLRVQR